MWRSALRERGCSPPAPYAQNVQTYVESVHTVAQCGGDNSDSLRKFARKCTCTQRASARPCGKCTQHIPHSARQKMTCAQSVTGSAAKAGRRCPRPSTARMRPRWAPQLARPGTHLAPSSSTKLVSSPPTYLSCTLPGGARSPGLRGTKYACSSACSTRCASASCSLHARAPVSYRHQSYTEHGWSDFERARAAPDPLFLLVLRHCCSAASAGRRLTRATNGNTRAARRQEQMSCALERRGTALSTTLPGPRAK